VRGYMTGQDVKNNILFRAGTLTYTKTGLGMLFFWLLWGYFVYGLMEIIIPSLLPLILREHKASSVEISFITTSLNVIGNMIFNPIVSFRSDRSRSRYGRRRPYIVWTTPLVVLCLALIPYGPDIARYLQGVPAFKALLDLSPVVPPILLISVFVMGFQIFDTFVGAVYYYLVRDTVPEEFIGRYYGVFRVVGAIAPLLFNLFIFGHAEQYMKAIFVSIAVFYGVGIYLMCWRVKEGEFPPPEPLPGHATSPWGRLVAAIRLYLGDCFRHRIYWAFFLASAMTTWTGAAGAFGILFTRHELGIPLATLGRIGAVGSVLTVSTAVFWGWYADKHNPFRIVQVTTLLRAITPLLCFFFVHDAVTLLLFGIVNTLAGVGFNVATPKMQIAVWPREKYGQFGSANSAFGSLGMIGLAVLAAKFVDWEGHYRAQYIWVAAFGFASVFFYVWLEKEWHKLGGKDNYKAP
jgi:maltose/moltooligosaccharide transporter